MNDDILGGFLVCDRCGHREPIGDISAPGRLSTPHCGKTMRWAAAGAGNAIPQLDDEVEADAE